MNRLLIILCLSIFAVRGFTQTTATNFNCNDCSGINHDLFSDLDAGKVVVIIWVMPCATCINPALTAQTEVQNALAINPGRVKYYLVDDYANTNCTTLSSWVANNGLTDAVVFSNSSISMTSYGTAGMPKIVVLGGSQHTVFYNQNEPAITATGIRDAITLALSAPLSLAELNGDHSPSFKFQNPCSVSCKLDLDILKNSSLELEIYNQLGQRVSQVFSGDLSIGNYQFTLNAADLANGFYFVNLSDGKNRECKKLIVDH